jgi:hypothetical protein
MKIIAKDDTTAEQDEKINDGPRKTFDWADDYQRFEESDGSNTNTYAYGSYNEIDGYIVEGIEVVTTSPELALILPIGKSPLPWR